MNLKKLLITLGVSISLIFGGIAIGTALITVFTGSLVSVSDSDCIPSGSGGDINIDDKGMEANAKSLYDTFIKEEQATPQGGAGALGALEFESRLNPKAENPSSGAYGIAQWLGSRLDELTNLAKSKGKEKSDLGVQVQLLLKELNDPYYKKAKDGLKLTDVHDAQKEWLLWFEGLSGDPSQWHLDERNAMADKWFAKFGTSDPAGGSAIGNATDGEQNTLDCSSNSGDGGEILDVAKNWLGYFYYVQLHPSSDLGSDFKNPNKSGGTDCSGYVWLVLNKAGYKVPQNMGWFTGSMTDDARGSHHYLKEVSEGEADAGDIVIVNQGAGAGNNGHTAILMEKWHGKGTKIIEQGGTGDSVNTGTFGDSFMSLLDGGDVCLARAIK
ncbi:phage tail tip lysozyme [Enterococcus raffinosus]|uniref:phage tail tip lysozyme n=1 Tax=Enterococcus raffinosus TaxID=71452 RepID=UPI0028915C42|nr:phage tail tip lysozyme [Enterococcus raffinosus]MDT2525140.1 phage tail tip lysozyme [Enterococcus raffinosus]MDT2592495.1 phage tail tip lysozyme [Enterococcus raffinosus]